MQATSKKAEVCVETTNSLLDRLETWHTLFPKKNTVFDAHATQMTETQLQPNFFLPSIHSLHKIDFD